MRKKIVGILLAAVMLSVQGAGIRPTVAAPLSMPAITTMAAVAATAPKDKHLATIRLQ